MELGEQQWRESLFLRYGIEASDLPDHCNGCRAEFSIYHALECKKGGLITEYHNELCDGVAEREQAFTPTHVRDDLKINTGRSMQGGKDKLKGYPLKDEEEMKGDLLIKQLWTQETDSIHDMCFLSQNSNKCLDETEKEKKRKYFYACLKPSPP